MIQKLLDFIKDEQETVEDVASYGPLTEEDL